jgi:hypothetical protein
MEEKEKKEKTLYMSDEVNRLTDSRTTASDSEDDEAPITSFPHLLTCNIEEARISLFLPEEQQYNR